MSEHLLFLQAAGSDFNKAHDLVAAIVEAIRVPHGDQACGDNGHHHSCPINGCNTRRRGVDPERIAERVERAGCEGPESLLLAVAAHATVASPFRDVDLAWMASATARIGDADLLLEVAGVMFTFNTVNRVANALQVKLEYGFIRKFKPIRGWVERRLASLTGLVYDLSYKHQPRHSPEALLDRLNVLFERLGAPAVPDVFNWLCQSSVVLEGIVEMLEANVTSAGVRLDLFKEAAAIAVASHAIPGSGLSAAVDKWLPHGSLPDSHALRKWAAPSGISSDSSLESACRRYLWQVANAAHTISEKQIRKMSALGLGDAELLDLTLAASLFSALAIIEPIGAAVATNKRGPVAQVAITRDDQVQSALQEELAA
jgi:alkylhydroperoxidase family enzyme